MKIPIVGHESRPVIQIDFSFYGPNVSAQTGVNIVMNTSKKPVSILNNNANSKFVTLANTDRDIATIIKLTDKISFMLFDLEYIFAPTKDPIESPRYTKVPSNPNPISVIFSFD